MCQSTGCLALKVKLSDAAGLDLTSKRYPVNQTSRYTCRSMDKVAVDHSGLSALLDADIPGLSELRARDGKAGILDLQIGK